MVNLVPAINIGRPVDGGLLTKNKVTINAKVSRVDVYKDNILAGSVTTNSYLMKKGIGNVAVEKSLLGFPVHQKIPGQSKGLHILMFLLSMIFSANAQIKSCDGVWFEGDGTQYGGVAGGEGGHCGIPIEAGDMYHCAMNHEQYAGSNSCGTCVRILGPKGEVILKVADECPECKFGDIDLTTAVYPQIAELKDGRVKIKWQYVPCPSAKDIVLLFAPGSGPYYFKVQVRDSFYPIAKLEYRKSNGTFDIISRVVYNYFVKQEGIDENKLKAGPYHFRFTSSTGQVIEADSIVFSTTSQVHTGVQFTPLKCPDCAGVLDGTAKIDFCNVCSGGNTGIEPNSNCKKDCAGYWNENAYLDGCGKCVAGTTGATPCDKDCNNDPGGLAFLDQCGTCVGGRTSLKACKKDCNNDWGGTAMLDSCRKCSGGKTKITPINSSTDCLVSGLEVAMDLETSLQIENPINNELIVSSNQQILKLKLTDLSGNTLAERNSDRISTSSLANGMYIVSVWFSDRILVKRILKY